MTFVYVVLISLSSFVFFCLALLAIQEHTATIKELQADNVELWANGVAVEFERRLRRTMEKAVSDPHLRAEGYALLDQDSLDHFESRLATLKEKHPAIEHVFVLRDGALLYPPADGARQAKNPGFSQQEESSFSRSYSRGKWHYRQGRFEEALNDFQRSLAEAPSAVLEAESLNRIAETLEELNYATAADEAYARLGSRYGDYLDQEGQPYSVVAALGRTHLEVRPERELIEHLEEVRRDLLEGRWPLNLESLKSIDQLLAEAVPDSPQLDQVETQFLRDLRWQAARSKLLALPAGSPDHLSSHRVLVDGIPFQVFYQTLQGEQESVTLGVAVTSNWLNNHLLPESLDEIASSRKRSVTVDLEDAVRPGATSGAIHVPIGLTPHWNLAISTEALQEEQSDLRFRMAALTISSVMFLAVLGLGIWLTFRMARKIHTHEAQTEFLNSFSHEVKTPLALVQLYSETLLGGEGSKEERDSYYRIIHHATERLKRLVVNFQNLALIRQDQKRYELREVDLVDLLTRSLSSYVEHLEHRGFTVDVSFHGQKLIAEADPEAVIQAVMNLLDNARKYSGESKYIAIRLGKESDHAVLEVLDKGLGISDEDKERIFDRFYRGAHQSRSSGFGFGLFLVQHIMEAHKGQVEFETREGEGTTFRLVFPLVTDPDKLRVTRELPELEKPLHGGRYAQDSHY